MQLLDNPATASAQRQAARRYAADHAGWCDPAAAMLQFYRSLLERRACVA
jgi:hypothetical protein